MIETVSTNELRESTTPTVPYHGLDNNALTGLLLDFLQPCARELRFKVSRLAAMARVNAQVIVYIPVNFPEVL
jgi:hypothetical protein